MDGERVPAVTVLLLFEYMMQSIL